MSLWQYERGRGRKQQTRDTGALSECKCEGYAFATYRPTPAGPRISAAADIRTASADARSKSGIVPDAISIPAAELHARRGNGSRGGIWWREQE
jgi:hypothetical protein